MIKYLLYKYVTSIDFSRLKLEDFLLSTRDLPDPETEPRSLVLQADSLSSEPPEKSQGSPSYNKTTGKICKALCKTLKENLTPY